MGMIHFKEQKNSPQGEYSNIPT